MESADMKHRILDITIFYLLVSFSISSTKGQCCYSEDPTNGCDLPCNCEAAGDVCDFDTGSCPGECSPLGYPPNNTEYAWRGTDCHTGNIAYNMPTAISYHRAAFSSDKAVDSMLGTATDSSNCARTYPGTGDAPDAAWWQVDLQEDYVIESVHVHTSLKGGWKYFENFVVTVLNSSSDTVCQSVAADTFDTAITGQVFNLSCGVVGQIVEITKDSRVIDSDKLDICEVIVIGSPVKETCSATRMEIHETTGRPSSEVANTETTATTNPKGQCCYSEDISNDCAMPCNCEAAGDVCDFNTGSCQGECTLLGYPPNNTEYAWRGTDCHTGNIAYGMPTAISYHRPAFSSDKAVDSRLGTDVDSSNCTRTYPGTGDAPDAAWWQVDLQEDYVIESVYIHTSLKGGWTYFENFIVIILNSRSGTVCQSAAADTFNTANKGEVFTLSCGAVGQFVEIAKDSRVIDSDKLDICEVIVIGSPVKVTCSTTRMETSETTGRPSSEASITETTATSNPNASPVLSTVQPTYGPDGRGTGVVLSGSHLVTFLAVSLWLQDIYLPHSSNN